MRCLFILLIHLLRECKDCDGEFTKRVLESTAFHEGCVLQLPFAGQDEVVPCGVGADYHRLYNGQRGSCFYKHLFLRLAIVSPMHLAGTVSVDFAVLESEAGVGDMLTLLSSASGKCSSAQALHWLGCVTSGGRKCRSNSNRLARLQGMTNVAALPLGSMPGEQ
jgi:hypothetical protein